MSEERKQEIEQVRSFIAEQYSPDDLRETVHHEGCDDEYTRFEFHTSEQLVASPKNPLAGYKMCHVKLDIFTAKDEDEPEYIWLYKDMVLLAHDKTNPQTIGFFSIDELINWMKKNVNKFNK